jgi:sec-independent protein translocase protein TatA
MGWIGPGEIILILLFALVLFGPRQLPEIGRIIGKGLKEIRKFSQIDPEELLSGDEEKPAQGMEIPANLTPSPDPPASFCEAEYVEEARKASAQAEAPLEPQADGTADAPRPQSPPAGQEGEESP